MGQDFFKNLPVEILINILSRLPIPTTISCKCVCKPWLNLISTSEFVDLGISKSVQGLIVFSEGENSKPYKIVEFVDDEVDLNRRWNTVFNVDLPFREPPHSSVNGLLFLCKQGHNARDLVLCNPITHEYIILPSPRLPYSKPMFQLETYGFGVSKVSGEYKVVRLFLDEKLPLTPAFNSNQFECQVYTVGTTGFWRRIPSSKRHMYGDNNTAGAFLNGNLHWLAREGSSEQISCLDLETESFSTLSPPPPPPPDEDPHKSRNLCVLGDLLCVCDNSAYGWTSDSVIDVWLMKEYGDERSWTKDFVIRKANRDDFLGRLSVIKVFKDEDILLLRGGRQLLHYSGKAKTIWEAKDAFGPEADNVVAYAPSFLSLKTFATENVSSFDY